MFKLKNIHVFRIPSGEEIVSYINEYAEKHGIEAGMLSIIGSLENVEIGYYDRGLNKYVAKTFPGTYELVSGNGNISLKEGKPMAHIHVVIGDRNYNAHAGHLVKATVYVAEVVILEFEGDKKLVREHMGGDLWLWRTSEE
ncbi:PPC domain-containing DNA-binding protein [Staphylothermus hellenicus]|uniref:PPC domain-containing protein n=1 Tax=Staphylothermus hellenicus (strain DSM 12710 / JCM 10830 / BK20S6-10-b1 / P8) TaxID=591019 RepID=D7DBK7_STAHD|nr:PPC domain-containing DNA-binding protein [Staphylothermus hellenicus]ADI31554.1 protein of unknown function DUF296 [Staphylothermus hellenicus DSM 12710]